MPYVAAHQPISVFSTDPCKSHVTRNTINDGNTQTLSPRLLRAEQATKFPPIYFVVLLGWRMILLDMYVCILAGAVRYLLVLNVLLHCESVLEFVN